VEYLEKYTDLSQLYWWRSIWRNIPTCHSYIGGGVSGEIYQPVTVIFVEEYLKKYTDLSQLYWWMRSICSQYNCDRSVYFFRYSSTNITVTGRYISPDTPPPI
jgi:hypothetical protein